MNFCPHMSVIKSGDNAKTVQEKGKDNVIDLAPKMREKHYRDSKMTGSHHQRECQV